MDGELDALFPVDDYLYFMRDTLRDEDTPAQVSFVAAKLGLAPGARVLDLGCGHGRHALELARRGHRVTGVDAVRGFVELARDAAAAEGLRGVDFVHGDMAEAPLGEGTYDGAVCLFDAFGFHDDARNTRVLARARDALRPGGRIALDLRTREFVTRLAPVSVLDMPEGDMMIDRMRFDMMTSRLEDTRTTVRGGVQRTVRFAVRVYAFTEIALVLASVGLHVVGAFGGFADVPPSPLRPRMLVVAERV